MFSDNHPAWFCTVWTGNGNTHHNRRIPSIGLSENQKQLWSRSFTIKSCYSPSPDMKKDFLSCFSLRTDQIHLLLKCHFIKSIACRSSSILKNRCMFEVSCIIYSRRDEPTRTSSTQTTFHSQILVPFQLIAIHTHKSYWKPRNCMDISILNNKTQDCLIPQEAFYLQAGQPPTTTTEVVVAGCWMMVYVLE